MVKSLIFFGDFSLHFSFMIIIISAIIDVKIHNQFISQIGRHTHAFKWTKQESFTLKWDGIWNA